MTESFYYRGFGFMVHLEEIRDLEVRIPITMDFMILDILEEIKDLEAYMGQ
jgi:hypothetical protein